LDLTQKSQIVKQIALDLGFNHVGIGKAEFMEPEAKRLEDWLNHSYHGKMGYLANHFDKRVDPTKLVEGSKSVICLMYNYFPEETQKEDTYKIAKYAYGQDYHSVIKEKLKIYLELLREKFGAIDGRCFVDSAPVLERDWAKRSGLGWIGKNTLLLNKERGSFYFLAELIVDLELDYDHPVKDHCGTCTKCIDACPTEAISPDGYVLDGSKCISYLTIELKDSIPSEFEGKMADWIFGCDICQDVCPWNRFSIEHREPLFEPSEELLGLKSQDWEELTEEVFRQVFKKSAIKRTKFSGLKRNITFASTHQTD